MAFTQQDPPSLVALTLFGASGDSSTLVQTAYNAPTYFPPTYFYGGAGASSVPTDPTLGLAPYNAPTYFPPTYFYGGTGVSSVITDPTLGLAPYNAPTYFPPTYFYGGAGASSVPTDPIPGLAPYNAPTYFPPAYFSGGPASPVAIDTNPKCISGRDGPCYAALVTAVEATGLFDSVVFGDPTRRSGSGADSHPLAVVTPRGWEEADETDAILYVRRVSFTIRIVIRVEEDASPFDLLDRLTASVQAQVDQSDLNGECLAALTKIRAGRYQPASQYPEWSVDLDGEFSVLIDPTADPVVV